MSIDTQLPPPAESAVAEPKLIPVLSSRWILQPRHWAITAVFAALFVVLNHMPLRGTDLWGHIVYGRQILAERALPVNDPVQPLADGMRVVDLLWLSQVAFAGVERLGGAEALTALFTLVVWLTYVVLARTFFRQTGRAGLSTLVALGVLAVGWSRVTTIRPENFAVLLFAILLNLLVARRVRRGESVLADDTAGDAKLWIGIPLLVALWTNLHGSFPIAIATLGCFWLGRVVEVAWHERSLKALVYDREARRLLVWTELAVVATLCNPYGIDAWFEALGFSANANIRDLVEWGPLVFLGIGGREFLVGCVLLAIVLRHSRRAIPVSDVLMLLLFGLAAAWQVRMIGWFAIVWGVALAPQLADVVARMFAARKSGPRIARTDEDDEIDVADTRTPAMRYRYTLLCGMTIWLAFAFSSVSRPLLGGAARSEQALYGDSTPRAAVKKLHELVVVGQAYNPQYWGDWLAWAGPPSLKPFASTHVHLLPRTVWNDYRRITLAEAGWDSTMEKYKVRTALVDKREQPALARALRQAADWALAYEDEQALIFLHKSTLVPPPTPPAEQPRKRRPTRADAETAQQESDAETAGDAQQ